MLNPLTILKGAKVFLIIGAVIFLISFLKTCEETRVAERDAAIAANAEKVSAQANAANLAIANAQLEAITKAQAVALAAAARARIHTEDQFRAIAQSQQEQKSVLEGNKLNRVIRSNRERVETLMNNATRERFDEVERIFNES